MSLLADIRKILATDGPVLQRFQAIEDRVAAEESWEGVRAQLAPAPDCQCGDDDCQRGVCVDDGPEAA